MATKTRKTSNVANELETIDDRIEVLETTSLTRHTPAELKVDYESNADTNAFDDTYKAKLDGIESGAQVNPTAAVTKTSYESNENTNAFTDDEKAKLLAIDAGAQVNPSAAVIKSEYESNANTNAFTDGDVAKLTGIEDNATADQTGSEIKTAYETNADTNAFTDAHKSKLEAIEAGATADLSAAEIKSLYESNGDTNAFLDSDRTKLDGIETNATADMTGAEIRAALASQPNTEIFTFDEKNKLSLIEAQADRTDTENVVAALTAGTNITISSTGIISATGTSSGGGGSSSGDTTFLPGSNIIFDTDNNETTIHAVFNQTLYEVGDGGLTEKNFTAGDRTKLDSIDSGANVNRTPAEMLVDIKTVDGVNSGLDADLLDGNHGNYYLDFNNAVNKPTIGDGGLTEKNFTTARAATVDAISPTWVKTTYEGNADTNAFTDSEKTKLSALPTTAISSVYADPAPYLSSSLNASNNDISNINDLYVNNNASIDNTVTALVLNSLSTITANGTISTTGTLVGANLSVSGNALVSGTEWVSGALVLNNNASLTLEAGSAANLQAVTVASTLTANGVSTFNDAVTVNDAITAEEISITRKARYKYLEDGFQIEGGANHDTIIRLWDSRANINAKGSIGPNRTYGAGRRFEIKAPNHTNDGVNRWLEHSETGETFIFSQDQFAAKINSTQDLQWGYLASNLYTTLTSGADTGLSISSEGKIHSGIDDYYGHFWVFNGADTSCKIFRFMFYPTTTNDGNGEVGSIKMSGGSTQFLTTSDVRRKTETDPNPDCLTAINRLTPREFILHGAEHRQIGLYAQEVEAAGGFESSISVDDESGYYEMDYSKLVGALVGAVKTLSQQNEELSARVSALEAKN